MFTLLCSAVNDPISSSSIRTREILILRVTLDRAPPRKKCSRTTRCLCLGSVVSKGCNALWHLMPLNVLLLAFKELISVGVLSLVLSVLLSDKASQVRVDLTLLSILLLEIFTRAVSL